MNQDQLLDIEMAQQTSGGMDRSDFIKTLGGGIFFFVTIGPMMGAQRSRRPAPKWNAYLRIAEDGRVSCFTGKIEMGQGIITSLAQTMADDLGCPVDDIVMVMGDTDLCPYDQGTWGSMTTRFFGPAMRLAATEARMILIEMGAEKLKTTAEKCDARDGVVFIKSRPRKKVTYAELAQGRKIEQYLDVKPTPKDVKAFRLIGKPMKRLDALSKVTGEAEFAGDIILPGMVYGKILRPPAHGAKLKGVDTSGAKKIAGAEIIRDGDLVAVLHESWDLAERALNKVKADWEVPSSDLNEETIFTHLKNVAPKGDVSEDKGNVKAGKKSADHVVKSEFFDGYYAHAPIEPHTAVASMEGGKLTIWSSTQSPFGVRSQVARALKMDEAQVRVITPFVGGGFGGKGGGPQSLEAARLARLSGKPVKVLYTRAEEFFYDNYRPAAIVQIESAVANNGDLKAWDYGVYFAGGRGSEHLYATPNHKLTLYSDGWRPVPGSHPFATGAWRAPGANTNIFAGESQIDMMAVLAGMDPLEFRLRNLKNKQVIGVLEAAAKQFGYTPAVGPSGRGIGIACGIDAGTYVAEIGQVEVDRNTGHVQVKRVVCAQDMGLVINPEGAIAQIEGCITMGLGYCLTEEVHFRGGELLDLNFDTYELPRFASVPKIESVLIKADDMPPQGGGEPAIVLMGGVIANAIFDATGARLYQMPMTPKRVLAALKEAGEQASD